MTTHATEKAAPIPAERLTFGDAVTNIAASDENPIKHGWFIRRGKRSGRVNAGSFVEYATADGRLHQTPPDNIAPRDAEPVFRADRASQEERIREDEREALARHMAAEFAQHEIGYDWELTDRIWQEGWRKAADRALAAIDRARLRGDAS